MNLKHTFILCTVTLCVKFWDENWITNFGIRLLHNEMWNKWSAANTFRTHCMNQQWYWIFVPFCVWYSVNIGIGYIQHIKKTLKVCKHGDFFNDKTDKQKIFQFKSEEITLMKVILYNLKKKKQTNTHSHGKHIQHKNSKEKNVFSKLRIH